MGVHDVYRGVKADSLVSLKEDREMFKINK